MAAIEIRIPQLGEGLQEARIVRFLKKPGDSIQRDEPIFEMETDKAVMEIESPVAGILGAWEAREDQVLPIGAVVGSIEAREAGPESGEAQSPQRAIAESYSNDQGDAALRGSDASNPAQPVERSPNQAPRAATPSETGLRNASVPPRTRAYAKEKGITDDELRRLAQESEGRLLPEAIDHYLAAGDRRAGVEEKPPRVAKGSGYQDQPLPQRQRTLVYRLQRATKDVIPATMEMAVPWSAIEAVRATLKKAGGVEGQATQFLLFAHCVAQAAANYPQFRSALLNDETIRIFDHLNLGIAVARPPDELLMARVDNADSLSLLEFVSAAQNAIGKARNGQDQTTDAMQLSLTNMAGTGVRVGIPVVAAPSVATLFIGEAFDESYPLPGGGIGFRRIATMVLSFDHRIANGVGAAKFLAEVRDRVARISEGTEGGMSRRA